MTDEDGYAVYRVLVEVTQSGWLDVNATNPEEAKRTASEALTYGSQPEYEDVWVEARRAFPKGAPCQVEDAGAKTPWCRIHDCPMRPDNSAECYDAWKHREAV